jgi:hypothetical protein
MFMERRLFLIRTVVMLAALSLQDQRSSEAIPSSVFGPIQARLDEKALKLHKIIDRGEHGSKVIYRIHDVNELIQQIRGETLGGVPGDDLPLRRYVEHTFPNLLPVSPTGSASEGDVRRVVEKANAVLKRLTALPTFRFDLDVISKPARAHFELIPPMGTSLVTTTNDKLTNIYRGEYEYEVRKAGYKTIHVNINFIDRSGNRLDCDLEPQSHKGEPFACRFN